jgi:hypothetical protein
MAVNTEASEVRRKARIIRNRIHLNRWVVGGGWSVAGGYIKAALIRSRLSNP